MGDKAEDVLTALCLTTANAKKYAKVIEAFDSRFVVKKNNSMRERSSIAESKMKGIPPLSQHRKRSSLEVLGTGVDFFVGSFPFSTVSEVCVVSTLRWLVPAAVETIRPRVESAHCAPPDSLREGCSADTGSCSWT
ncbi:hypothetical protein MTO96_050908 [Rhipicephalus appendiculatus]